MSAGFRIIDFPMDRDGLSLTRIGLAFQSNVRRDYASQITNFHPSKTRRGLVLIIEVHATRDGNFYIPADWASLGSINPS